MATDSDYEDLQRRRQSMRRRLKRNPDSLSFCRTTMADAEPRHCMYCGTLYQPDLSRACTIPGAPPSVVLYHLRAFCCRLCAISGSYTTKDDNRDVRIRRTQTEKVSRTAIFETDKWAC